MATDELTAVPSELRALPQWVVWRTETRDGKPTKVPYCANGTTDGHAKADDPTTWTTFEQASSWLELYSKRFDGLGFMFAADDPFAGVDLDDCIDPVSGELYPEAARMVASFSGAYVERSPSGTGVKLFTRARKPGTRCRTPAPWGGEVELYDSVRYFAVTGDALGAIPDEIGDGQAAMDALYAELFEEVRTVNGTPSSDVQARAFSGDGFQGPDDELVALAKSFTNGDKFSRLWSGDTSDHGGDDSRSDAALCTMLRFLCADDRERVWRIFRTSELGKREKAERDDYKEGTLDFVYRDPMDYYSGPSANGAHAHQASSKGVRIVKLSAIRPERVAWYVEGMIPKSLPTVLAAPGGTGKGLATLFFTATAIPGTVLYFGTEDSFEQIVVPRALALGMDVDRFAPVFLEDEDGGLYSMRFPRDRALLEEQIRATGATAFVLDSGVEHMEDGLQANKTEDVRKITNMLNHIARDLHVLPLDILHTNKNRDARGVDKVGNSKTWTDAARHVLMMARDDEDEDVRHVEVFKTNVGRLGYGRRYRIETRDVSVWDPESGLYVEDPVPYLVDDGESDKSVEDLLEMKRPESDEGDIDTAILGYLATLDEPVPSKHVESVVVERTGARPRTVANHRYALSKRGLLRSEPTTDERGKIVAWNVEITPDGLRELHGAPDDENVHPFDRDRNPHSLP